MQPVTNPDTGSATCAVCRMLATVRRLGHRCDKEEGVPLRGQPEDTLPRFSQV